MTIRLSVYERTEIAPGTETPWRYTSIDQRRYSHDQVSTPVEEAPQVGDLIFLGRSYRVIARSWLFTSYGSVAWPYGTDEPPEGHECVLIVVPEDGPFVGEAEWTDEEGDDDGE